MRKALLVLTLSVCIMLAQSVQTTGVVSLGTLTGVSATAALSLKPLTPDAHTLQVVVSGSPGSCSIQLEGTLDEPSSTSVNWANLSGAQDCTTSVVFHVVNKPVSAIRANLTVLSGGSVKIKYTGVQR